MELVIDGNRMEKVGGLSDAFPYVLNHADSAQMRVPWHWHEEVEFSYVRQGRLRVSIAGRTCEFGENEGFFINSNILHAMEPAEPEMAVLWDSHLFHPVLLGGHYRSVFETKYLVPVLRSQKFELVALRGDTDHQRRILEHLLRVAEVQTEEDREFLIRNLFSEIWIDLRKELAELENRANLPKPVSQERILAMLEFIHQHYPEKITLEQIAAAAVVSKRECLRCFQSCIQKTPFAYLLDYRIQMAEKLLRTSDLNMTEIAVQTGFSNSAYFAKTFRELRGLSPSQYRKAK